jgi:hypothetical protein
MVRSLHVLPKYGHPDSFFGKDAARDISPRMIEELNRGHNREIGASDSADRPSHS